MVTMAYLPPLFYTWFRLWVPLRATCGSHLVIFLIRYFLLPILGYSTVRFGISLPWHNTGTKSHSYQSSSSRVETCGQMDWRTWRAHNASPCALRAKRTHKNASDHALDCTTWTAIQIMKPQTQSARRSQDCHRAVTSRPQLQHTRHVLLCSGLFTAWRVKGNYDAGSRKDREIYLLLNSDFLQYRQVPPNGNITDEGQILSTPQSTSFSPQRWPMSNAFRANTGGDQRISSCLLTGCRSSLFHNLSPYNVPRG
jgi:hypothetical protein